MKIFKIAVPILAIICAVAFAGDQATYIDLPLNATTVAATSTNSNAGTVRQMYIGQTKVRLYVTASGVAATTNGSLIVRLSTASGTMSTTNEFDTASSSKIYVTMSTLGNTTNTVSDWFFFPGVQWVRVGSIENTFAGAVSNITVRLAYAPQP